jgi:hypothetical protein
MISNNTNYMRNSTDEMNKSSTGNYHNDVIELTYPFEKYEIKVLVDSYGKFIGINEIKINKDFRSLKQKIESTGYIDVEDLYKEE